MHCLLWRSHWSILASSGVAIVFSGRDAPATEMLSRAPPPGGPGSEGPRTVAKFHFLKRCKVLENECIIQIYQHFFLPKIHFLIEISNIEHISQESLRFFENLFKF